MLEQLIAGETSVRNLSEKLGLSERQVRYALKKLEEKEMIRYTFLLDHYLYPLEFVALFKHAKFKKDIYLRGRIMDFSLAMAKLRYEVAIDELSYGFGAYNALMHGYARSKDIARKFLNSIYSGKLDIFFIENAIIKNFAPAKPCLECEKEKLKKMHSILYEIIKNSKNIKKIIKKTGQKESRVRYIIKKLRKSNIGRYYIKVDMEKIYPLEFLLVTKDIISESNEPILTKNLLLVPDATLLQGFANDVKEIYRLMGKFTTCKVMIIADKVVENFILKEEYA